MAYKVPEKKFTALLTISDVISESRRAVPFHRGIFQPIPLATPSQGARGRVRSRGENKNWDPANITIQSTTLD